MDVFSIRDLRERVGELTREAEAGRLSIISKHGAPVMVTVPVDELLMRTGVMFAIAVRLYRDSVVSAAEAAKLCGLEPRAFFEQMAARDALMPPRAKSEIQPASAVVPDPTPE